MAGAPFVAMETDLRKEERVAFTADHCGYNVFEALGRYFALWAWCSDRGLEDAPDDSDGYAVPDAVVRRFLGPLGVDGILGDGCDALAMGERRPDGLIYLRGTHKTVGRLRAARTGSPAGGRSAAVRAEAQGRGQGGRFVAQRTIVQPSPGGHPARPPGASSEIPDPRSQIPDPEDQKLSLPRDPAVPPAVPVPHLQDVPPDMPSPNRQASRTIPPPAPITPEAKALHDARRTLFWRCWQLAGEAFARVQASGIDAHAPNGWAGTPDATSPPAQNLLAIIAGMLVGDRPDFAAAETKIANRIAVAEAEARAMSPPSARYMTPARIWNRDSFAIAVDMTPEQAATPVIRASRAGPRGSAARANSDPKIGRIEPPPASAFRGGIQKL